MLSALVIAAATFSAANVDTILGKWVCISHRSSASAGSPARPFTGAVLELRWDGVATYYRGGEAWCSRRFMRESGKEWASRFKGSQYLNDGIGIWGEYERPGVEMIYFQKGGKFKGHRRRAIASRSLGTDAGKFSRAGLVSRWG